MDWSDYPASHGILTTLRRGWQRVPSPLLLWPLLILGVVLRARCYAACPSYWYDEAYLLLNIFHKSFVELLGPLREDQAAPPLFLWCLRALYQCSGGGEWWMRLPALTASMAGLVLMVPLARQVVGRRGWLWAVAFCALGHHAAAHAAEVKPYTLDFLVAELILLACLPCLRPRCGGGPRVALCLLAVVAPWASYPSVFVLGAASVALLFHALWCERSSSVFWAVMTGLSLTSVLLLWLTVARHQATSVLQEYWAASFLDLSSPVAALGWVGRILVETGNYGTREMGGPLLLLGLVGAVSLWRRSPMRAMLLLGAFPLALAASALHRYPLGGRLLFFLVPCVWLLAARGVGILARFCARRRAVWIGWALPAAFLIPAVLGARHLLVEPAPRCQFREAFAYVEAQRSPGDRLWVSHPQVYEVYWGNLPELSTYSRAEEVERAARGGRLWMVCTVAGPDRQPTSSELVERLHTGSCVPLERRRFKGVEVILFVPSRQGDWTAENFWPG